MLDSLEVLKECAALNPINWRGAEILFHAYLYLKRGAVALNGRKSQTLLFWKAEAK